MNILLIEPFYAGSHKAFADQLKKYSKHTITLLTLEGKFWKWRMYGGAITLGQAFIKASLEPDMILATDMLDLPVFLSVVRKHLPADIPVITYFHENQLAYPWQKDSEDKQEKRDVHYGMMNYQTALASDQVLFNSHHNKNSFLTELETLLNRMPDHKHEDALQSLEDKSMVMPLGLELKQKFHQQSGPLSDPPLILWNHRWEHDKNPEDFFQALLALKEKGTPFRLAVLGQPYKYMPDIFKEVPTLFKDQLIHYGYADEETYLNLLNQGDFLPVTSSHDFFGISVMEAIHCGVKPLLPRRLSYTELYKPQEHPDLFYDTQKDLIDQLTKACQNHQPGLRDTYQHLTSKYDWSTMIHIYDRYFDTLMG